MLKLSLFLLLAGILAGCASVGPASVRGGECRILQDPGFRVRGLRTKDERWVSQTQETGIAVCGWRRPAREAAPAVSCDQVRQAVAAVGIEKAEAMAIQQGMTLKQRRQARACLTAATVTPEPVARMPTKKPWRQRLKFWRPRS